MSKEVISSRGGPKVKRHPFSRLAFLRGRGLEEADSDTIGGLQGNLRLQARILRSRLARDDILEALQDPHDRVGDLGNGELLADADARAHAEGNVAPRLGLPVEPSVRIERERVGVGRVEIGAAVQVDGGVCDRGVFEDAHGLGPGRPAATGQGRVAQCDADIQRDGGIETECFIDRVLCFLCQPVHLLDGSRPPGSARLRLLEDISYPSDLRRSARC